MTEDWSKERMPTGKYKPTLALSQIILDAHPWNAKNILIFGEIGAGKSVYALKVMQQIFRAFGYSEEEAWRLSLDSLVYKIGDFLEKVNEINTKDWVYPVLTIDDAGVGFDSKKYFSMKKLVEDFSAIFQTARTWITGLIFTTPVSGGLLKDIRKLHALEVAIIRAGGKKMAGGKKYEDYRRIAKALGKRPSYGGKLWFSKKKGYIDEFSCHLPDERHNEYWNIRKKYSRVAIKKLIEKWEGKTAKRKEENE